MEKRMKAIILIAIIVGAVGIGAREDSVSWVTLDDNLWLFGGTGYDHRGNKGELNDLWKYG